MPRPARFHRHGDPANEWIERVISPRDSSMLSRVRFVASATSVLFITRAAVRAGLGTEHTCKFCRTVPAASSRVGGHDRD
jgi:hypothetical protein